MKKFYALTILFLVIIFHVSIADAKEVNPRFEMETGARVSLSSLSSSTNVFYKPFLVLGCAADYFSINTGYAHYFRYRIIDSSFNERYIDLNKISADIEAYPVGGLFAGFEFSYQIGESAFAGTDYLVKLGYDFKKFSLYGEFSYNLWTYTMNRVKVDNDSYDIYFEGAYFIHDDFSIDLSYDHLYTASDELDLEIRNNIIRLGIMKGFKEMVYLMGGIGLGWTSSNYFIAAADAGISIYPCKYLRISAFYMYSYNYDMTTYSGNRSYSDSAYISDTSYDSHRFSIAVSFVYR